MQKHVLHDGEWRLGLLPVAICLLMNFALLTTVGINRPEYLRDAGANGNPDAQHYLILGRNTLTLGHYSRCHNPPFVPDMLRTPIYPLFAGGLDLLAGPCAIYAAQALLHAGSCFLLYLLVQRHFGRLPALVASLLLATDLMVAAQNLEAMSEPLFVFLVLGAACCLLPTLADLSQGKLLSVPAKRVALGGLLVGLAILTRPAALYLPLLMSGSLMIIGWRSGQPLIGLRVTALFLMATVPLPALWVARNAMVFSLPRITTVDAANNVYFVGGGAYQLRFGVSLEESHVMIAQEFGLPSYEISQNPWITERPVSAIDAELRNVSFRVMTKYPIELLGSSLLGVAKATVSHNVGFLATVHGSKWNPPGMASLGRLQPTAWRVLLGNQAPLVAAFAWELAHTAFALGFAVTGLVICATRPSRSAVAWTLALILAYFYLTVAAFGLEAYYRCRFPVLPFLYAFAGIGFRHGMAYIGTFRTGGG